MEVFGDSWCSYLFRCYCRQLLAIKKRLIVLVGKNPKHWNAQFVLLKMSTQLKQVDGHCVSSRLARPVIRSSSRDFYSVEFKIGIFRYEYDSIIAVFLTFLMPNFNAVDYSMERKSRSSAKGVSGQNYASYFGPPKQYINILHMYILISYFHLVLWPISPNIFFIWVFDSVCLHMVCIYPNLLQIKSSTSFLTSLCIADY